MRELIIGGARSGKSALAQCRAAQSGLAVVLIATATAGDAEMARRIERHRRDRPAGWTVVEEPLQLTAALRRYAAAGTCIVVDCLTLWLSNWYFAGQAAAQAEAGEPIDCAQLDGAIADLMECVPTLPGHLILISNELGCGVVPPSALARAFADEHGRLNQRAAAVCNQVTLTVAGLPLELKSQAA